MKNQADNSFCYFDKYLNMDAVKILPGEYYTSNKDIVLVTVLGSCISACIWDKKNKVGGINHFSLPNMPGHILHSRDKLIQAKYGNYAMELLLRELYSFGCQKSDLQVSIFGGSNMFSACKTNVGEKNTDFAISFLEKEGIEISAKDVMSDHPRKIYFFVKEGKIRVKKLESVKNNTISEREKEYFSQIKQARQ